MATADDDDDDDDDDDGDDDEDTRDVTRTRWASGSNAIGDSYGSKRCRDGRVSW